MLSDTRITRNKLQMNYTKDDFISVFQRYPTGIETCDSKTCCKDHFKARFLLFTQGLLNNFDYSNAVLSGGSLFTILDNNIDADYLGVMNSDLDLFITRSEDEEETLQKLQRTVDHFVDYAKLNSLRITFMVRGLLLEVMIQNKRRVQILLINNTKVYEFISSLAAVHIHMYFDGTLHASEEAIENIKRRQTRICRAPIKDVIIPVLVNRGITPVGDILITRMDELYKQTLEQLNHLKTRVDAGEDLSTEPQKYEFFVTTDRNELLTKTKNIYEAKWNAERLRYLKQLGITFDIDLFDLSIRLPAPEILYRCTFTKCSNGIASLLQLKGSFSTSPAIFIERQLVIDKKTQLFTDNCDILLEKSKNIKFLERYFDRQIVFRYLKHLSHVFDKNGNILIYNPIELVLYSHVNIVFLITINERLRNIMYADIIELQNIDM